MRLFYGSSLPPGLEGPTRGELRIRIEKLLLKDDLVTRGMSSDVSHAGSRPYAVPVDHCAVNPLFWGEQHPACHCVPATPGKPRGVVTLVYPLKTYEPQFNEYLLHMSHSEQKGLQISVFVPTSYSGRHRSVPVGKTIVALGTLKPSSPVSGWFTIVSDGAFISSTPCDKEMNLTGSLLEVGRLKMTFTLTFFARAPLSPTSHASHSTYKTSHEKNTEKEKIGGTEMMQDEGRGEQEVQPAQAPPIVSTESGVIASLHKQQPQQHQETQQSHHQGHGGATEQIAKSPMMHENAGSALACGPRPSSSLLPPTATSINLNQKMAISELLQKGISLRDKMARVLSHSTSFEDMTPSSNFLTSQPLLGVLGGPPSYSLPLTGAEHLHSGLSIPPGSTESSVSSASVETVVSDTNELGIDASPAAGAGTGREKSGEWCDIPTGRRPFKLPFQSPGVSQKEDTYVEVDLSRIAFSSGRATLGMEEMRVGIRLSRDVKTDEPVESYSSYVHRVPLARGAEHHIVIGFSVRSFSEDRSRMVISFYRVRSAPVANPPGELLLPVPASAQRVLVEEILLGMCIVGLHSQSRDIVLHDPISGEDPTQAHLRVSTRSGKMPLPEESRPNVGAAKEGEEKNPTSRLEKGEKSQVLVNSTERHSPIETQRGTNPIRPKVKYSHIKQSNVDLRNSFSSSSSPSSSSPSSPSSPSSREKMPRRVRMSASGEEGIGAGSCTDHGDGRDLAPESIYAHEQRPSNSPTAPIPNTIMAKAAVSSGDQCLSPVEVGSLMDLHAPRSCDGKKVLSYANDARMADTCVDQTLKKPALERFRIHVSIRAGKELPMVTISHEGFTSISPIAAADQLDSGVRSAVTSDGSLILVDSKHRVFKPPTTFFVVEDLFNGVDSRAASRGIVPDWFVEAAVRGKYDRTLIVPESQSPQYDYESILSIPREAVFLRHAVSGSNATFRGASTLLSLDDTISKASNSAFCLRELRLTLWHAVTETSVASSSDWKNDEERFWAQTALLGECRVDLRSLRFLKVLDGWYRINAIDRVEEVVGYVRVSVRLL
ncbi:hypothetical protein MOQ_002601 [Trypanosoma cruzi marinkellei]|uniref:C2CD3 N-terminal C2 domain-containing protein n=1 Tax=Trypanosoma cruzi marinkellei TaxID=85056 RepID=K2N1Z5_TRYCR|nr:hypothetical protein MOQ_002601 [Trypanosoma cruzi marinkellei]